MSTEAKKKVKKGTKKNNVVLREKELVSGNISVIFGQTDHPVPI